MKSGRRKAARTFEMTGFLIALIFILTLLSIVAVAASCIQGRTIMELKQKYPNAQLSHGQPVIEEQATAPLQGVRIALAITQDHPNAVFVELLKDQLFAQDVTDIVVLTPTEATSFLEDWKTQLDAPEILISGNVICNGYTEIYYTAEFTCSNREQAICTLIEKPPQGDRPVNLAIELVARLKKELEKLISRNERRQAIRELKN
jgi:hypothetical protein